MPTVGKKKFAYTKEGIKKAKRYAKRKKRSLSKKKYDEGGTYQYTHHLLQICLKLALK